MLDISEIQHTRRMFDENRLDVRTITMGISLRGCQTSDGRALATRIYDHICRTAQHLVATGDTIAREYGIPIINKRVSVTPIALIAEASDLTDYTPIARALDRAADTVGVDFIGGFSALTQSRITRGDRILLD